MTAPTIINIDIPSVEVMYPRRVAITVTFDQPVIYSEGETDVVIFEAKTALSFTNLNYGFGPVGLGQVQVKSQQVSPIEVEFSFQVSPFADGPLQISNRPWNLPFVFKGRNTWGEPVDWSPFLVPGLFEPVVQKPFFTWFGLSSPNISPPPFYTLSPQSAAEGASKGQGVNPGIVLKFGPSPNYPATPLYENFWNEGKFWWWYDIMAENSRSDLWDPGTRRAYAYSTCGFQLTSTQPVGPCPPFPNSGGTNPATGGARQYYNFNTCNTQEYCVRPWIRSVDWIRPFPEGWVWNGRLNNWIISTPNMDLVQPGPSGWYNNVPSSVNDYNLSPWNLASKDKGPGMLFQCYVNFPWGYLKDRPIPD